MFWTRKLDGPGRLFLPPKSGMKKKGTGRSPKPTGKSWFFPTGIAILWTYYDIFHFQYTRLTSPISIHWAHGSQLCLRKQRGTSGGSTGEPGSPWVTMGHLQTECTPINAMKNRAKHSGNVHSLRSSSEFQAGRIGKVILPQSNKSARLSSQVPAHANKQILPTTPDCWSVCQNRVLSLNWVQVS